jgi:hypothetical protein
MGVNILLGSIVDRTIEGHKPLLFALMDAKATDAVLAVLRIFAPSVGEEVLDQAGRTPIQGKVVNR